MQEHYSAILIVYPVSCIENHQYLKTIFYCNVDRYGQEDIETMLRGKGAQETVEIPKKVSLPGEVDPPWVRKSSRRESRQVAAV